MRTPDDSDPPRNVDEALRRSSQHARNAVAEALLAARALLDAASIAASGRPASAGRGSETTTARVFAALSDQIDEIARIARGADAGVPTAVLAAVLDALDLEIARWEQQSRDDRDARAVLRAFLGLREILWELGVRNEETNAKSRGEGEADFTSPGRTDASAGEAHAQETTSRGDSSRRPTGRGSRVQRIDVEG